MKKHFDISSPREKTASRPKKNQGHFWIFFVSAFSVFVVLMGFSLYFRGGLFLDQNKKMALEGYDSLKKAAGSLGERDVDGANFWLDEAKNDFKSLTENTRLLTAQMTDITGGSPYLDTAETLTQSAVEIADLGKEALGMIERMEGWPERVREGGGERLVGLLREERSVLGVLYERAITLQNRLAGINISLLPSDLRGKIDLGRNQVGDLLAAIKKADGGLGVALTLLGDKNPHRYMIVLQNNSERRATGGFIGSYVLLDINDGKITKMEGKDVYEADGQLTERVPAPLGINKVSDAWYLRDANYSPDFPTSAQKIMWFLEHSRQPSVDTVIAINQTVVEGLLEMTGPVFVDGIPFQINANSFETIFSYYVEAKLGSEASPKALMFEMIPLLQKQVAASEDLKKMITFLEEMVRKKHLQVYSNDESIQEVIRFFAVDGVIPRAPENSDFLSVVTTSIGGNKSDAYIKTDIAHRSEIAASGAVTNHLYIQKTHTWQKDEFIRRWAKIAAYYGGEKLDEDTLRFILGEGENRDYMRVYVPRGAKLLVAEGLPDGVSMTEDLGYTVFGFYFPSVPAKHSRAVTLHYTLPYQLSFDQGGDSLYRFIASSQAGVENITLKKSMTLEKGLSVGEIYPASEGGFSDDPTVTQSFDENRIFVAEVKK